MITLPGSHGPTARQRWLVLSFCTLLMAGSVRPAHSQSQMYIYPAKGQNQQQQDKDRYECHNWAVQQSGFDPSKAYPGNPNYYDPQPYNPSQPHVMRGAGRGAAMGAVGGAIGGNAGKGAAAGAAVGAMAGGFRRRETSAGSKLLRSSNKLKRRPQFRPGISARWLRVCRDAGTLSIERNLAGFPLCHDLDEKTVPKSRLDSSSLLPRANSEIADFRGRTEMMPRAPRGFPPQVSLWKLRLLPFAQLAYGRSPRLQIQRDARLALTKVD